MHGQCLAFLDPWQTRGPDGIGLVLPCCRHHVCPACDTATLEIRGHHTHFSFEFVDHALPALVCVPPSKCGDTILILALKASTTRCLP